jgi:hypothetical protein
MAAISRMRDSHALIDGGFFVLKKEKQPWSEPEAICSGCFTDRMVASTMDPGTVGGCLDEVCYRQRSVSFQNQNPEKKALTLCFE